MSETKPAYVMGHTDRERRRLAIQAAVLNPLTESFLRRAGISAGMRVLELGCGVGDVSLLAAGLVGPYGRVHCLDVDPAAIEIAEGRCRAADYRHVVFERVDVSEHKPAGLYDAVIGRHILLHMRDALAVLRRAVELVHEGGVIAFQEYDLSWHPSGYPEMPLRIQIQQRMQEFFRRAVAKPNIGMQLFSMMQEAGLPPPECRAECVADGGPHSLAYEWLAETLITLSARFAAVGMQPLSEADTADLTERLRAEALENRGMVMGPMMIGAFARKVGA